RQQREVAVGQRSDDEAALEPREPGHGVGPRVQPMPDAGQVIARGRVELVEAEGRRQRVERLAMEHVEDRPRPAARAHLVERRLRREGYRPETTSEPDGTALGVAVRRLFEREPRPLAEMFLFMAARHQHVVEKVRPWLRAGRVVLCDRYTDATVAYQGYGRGVDPELIRDMNVQATGGVLPDLTLLFDLDPAIGFRRIAGRKLDRFEREKLAFHRRVRRGYLAI